MKEGYDYAQTKLGVELVFGSTPKEEPDVEQLTTLQSWLTEGSFEGFVVTILMTASYSLDTKDLAISRLPRVKQRFMR